MELVMAVLTVLCVFGMARWLLGGAAREGDHVQELPDGTPFSEEVARARVEAAQAAAPAPADGDGSQAEAQAGGEAAAIAKAGRTVVLDDEGQDDESAE